MNTDNNIPLPSFKLSEIINRKATEFSNYRLRGVNYDVKKTIDYLQTELWELNKTEDRVQFVGFIIRRIIEDVSDHVKICKQPHCQVEPNSQKILYFLYGKLEEYGLPVFTEDFSIEEIRANNSTINQINSKLEEIKIGENIIYDDILEKIAELKSDLESLKGVYPLGKKKWYQLAGGMIASKTGDKAMDAIFEQIKPHLIHLIPYIKAYFLLS